MVGASKTSVAGLMGFSVVLFAMVLPARESTGALLPLLLVGDVVAIIAYRRHAAWHLLVKVAPVVAIGVILGAIFVAFVDDTFMRRAIGVILLLLLAFQVFGGRLNTQPSRSGTDPATIGYGTLSGFTTMVANSGGAPIFLYLLRSGLPKTVFIGTVAWFFFVVNMFKVPFAVGLGLISLESLRMDLLLVPAVLLGSWIGLKTIGHIPEKTFAHIVLAVVGISAVTLIVA